MTRVWFIYNFVFGGVVSGGTIQTGKMAQYLSQQGFEVRFMGGKGLRLLFETAGAEYPLVPTDQAETNITPRSPNEQIAVFRDTVRRCRGALNKLHHIQPDDIVVAGTDYWCDTIPVMRASARRKALYLGMLAPSWREIITGSRPDVPGNRPSAIHYNLSQNYSLRRFQNLPNKRIMYMHPEMQDILLQQGYRRDEIHFVSNGFSSECVSPEINEPKIYDAVWLGRIHPQKGIADLIFTLSVLSKTIPLFRVLIIGNTERELRPLLHAAGIKEGVFFSGFVPEAEKFRLLKQSRLFLMTSHYESWGIVNAEALACKTPVLAYDIPPYKPIFGDLINYVQCFDQEAYARKAAELVFRSRNGEILLSKASTAAFLEGNSWQKVGDRFVAALRSMDNH